MKTTLIPGMVRTTRASGLSASKLLQARVELGDPLPGAQYLRGDLGDEGRLGLGGRQLPALGLGGRDDPPGQVSSALRTPRTLRHRRRRPSPSLRAAAGEATFITASRAPSLLKSSSASRPGNTASRTPLSRAAGLILEQVPAVGDEEPQLDLLLGAHLPQGAPPEPKLVGDHAGVPRASVLVSPG